MFTNKYERINLLLVIEKVGAQTANIKTVPGNGEQ